MQVIEHEHDGCIFGRALEQVDHRTEEQIALGLGLARSRRRSGDTARKVGDEARELAATRGHVRMQQAARCVAYQMRERFGPRLIRGTQVFVAVAGEYDRAIVVRAAREVCSQGRLADSRFPGDDYRPASALDLHSRQRDIEQGTLVLASY